MQTDTQKSSNSVSIEDKFIKTYPRQSSTINFESRGTLLCFFTFFLAQESWDANMAWIHRQLKKISLTTKNAKNTKVLFFSNIIFFFFFMSFAPFVV